MWVPTMDKLPLSQSFGIGSRVEVSVSIPQACALVGVSRRTIYNWIKTGHLQTFRTPAGAVRVVLASLREEAAERGHATRAWPPPPSPDEQTA